jgi:DNA polymerase I-like protein with 3'-5' exonuclease and polymerase domains
MQLPLDLPKPPDDLYKARRCISAGVVALDIETQTKRPKTAPNAIKSGKWGLSYLTDVIAIGIAWNDTKTGYQTAALSYPFSPDEIEFLKVLLTSSALIVGHNLVFDIRGLSRLTGVWPSHTWDTFVMARVIHPEKQYVDGNPRGNFGLLGVANALKIEYPDYLKEQKKKRGRLHQQPIDEIVKYAGDDTLLALKIYEAQLALVNGEGLYALADWGQRASREFGRMTAEGLTLNVSYIKRTIRELNRKLELAANSLKPLGLDKPSSFRECAKWLYGSYGLPIPDWKPLSKAFTAKGHNRLQALHDIGDKPIPEIGDLSASGKYLTPLIASNPDLRDLADFINIKTRLSTLNALIAHGAVDGKIHSTVNIAAETTRRKSSDPQAQNWAMSVEPDNVAGDMCGVVIGREGFTLVEIDYSNAENWIAALLSGDSNLAAACAEEDFHSAMAKRYFGDRWTNATAKEQKLLRKRGKALTFGDSYGMGRLKLAASAGVSEKEAAELKAAKESAFPQMAKTRREYTEKAVIDGFVLLWSGQKVIVYREMAFRAWNYVCQGGVAQMILRAIVLISEEYRALGLESRVAADMHDAIVLEVKHGEWSQALDIATRVMESIMPERFNKRTTPPIRWIARPNLSENREKWGKFQTHFPYVSSISETKETEGNNAETVSTSQIVKSPLAKGTRRLGEAQKIVSIPAETERNGLLALLEGPYPTRLPIQDEKGGIVLGETIQVDLESFAKIPLIWLGIEETVTLRFGLSHEGLRKMAEERGRKLNGIKHKLMTLGKAA